MLRPCVGTPSLDGSFMRLLLAQSLSIQRPQSQPMATSIFRTCYASACSMLPQAYSVHVMRVPAQCSHVMRVPCYASACSMLPQACSVHVMRVPAQCSHKHAPYMLCKCLLNAPTSMLRTCYASACSMLPQACSVYIMRVPAQCSHKHVPYMLCECLLNAPTSAASAAGPATLTGAAPVSTGTA